MAVKIFSSNYLSLQTVLKQKKKSGMLLSWREPVLCGSLFNESSRGNAPSSQLKAAPPQVETHEFTTQNYKYERQIYYFIFK
jgi:hypothetical protein